jgi:hypothetical protein
LKRVILILFLFFVSHCTGCVIPQFTNSLSTADDSAIDERLVGHWEPVEINKKGVLTPIEPDTAFGQYIVMGRCPDKKDTIIVAQTKLSADGAVAHESRTGKVTRLDNESYISWELQPEERGLPKRPPPTDTTYTITTYTLQNKDTLLTMFMLDHEHIIEAIKEGRLAGVIDEEVVSRKGKGETEIKSVVIESTTAELRDYFTKFGSVAFNRGDPSYYRKVVK